MLAKGHFYALCVGSQYRCCRCLVDMHICCTASAHTFLLLAVQVAATGADEVPPKSTPYVQYDVYNILIRTINSHHSRHYSLARTGKYAPCIAYHFGYHLLDTTFPFGEGGFRLKGVRIAVSLFRLGEQDGS